MSSGKKAFSTKDLRQKSTSSPPKDAGNKTDLLQNVCFICATALPAFWAVGPCGHPFCALCALRLRAIFKTRMCPMCKSEHAHVYVGASMDALRYQQSMFEDNQGLGMYFEGGDAKRLVLAQSQVACVICKKQNFANKKDLQRHLEVTHKKLQCDLCVQHKPVFPFEQVLYDNQQAILQHQNAAKTGHPQCTVCHERFYSDDELTLHCRERHEQCFICSRNPQTARYFADYSHLQQHFDEAHFVCREAVCQEMRFVVFASELELKAHQRQVHLSQQKMQRSQQRLASRLQVPFGTPSTGSSQHAHHNTHNTHNNDNRNAGRRQRHPITTTSRETSVANSNNSNTQRQDEVIDHSWFLFDPSSSQTYAQSMSHLLQLNKNFTKYISECGKQAQLDNVRRECRSFQSGHSSGRQLVSFLYTHQFDVPVVGQRLLELLPERLKQADLQRALEEHQKIQAAFPSLPSGNSRTNSTVLRARGQATLAISEAPIRGRILSGTGNAGKTPRAAANPSRDPLALLGSLSLVGGSRPRLSAKTTAPPPQVSSTDFPALPSATTKSLPKTTSEDDSDDVFTIGGHQPDPSTSQGEQEATTNSKKGKKQLLMRFGGFSNPYNDT